MEFYGREDDLAALVRVREQSYKHSQMTVITGRRRVGKTTLIRKSLEGETFLYFFVAHKEEPLLVQEYLQQIKLALDLVPITPVSKFSHLFIWLCQVARQQHLNLVIDEFQEFFRINASIYSDMQNHWDQNKEEMKMNLILSGSVQTLMRKIFDSYAEPLFGRATAKLFVLPFGANTLLSIARDHRKELTAKDFLTLYTITGGIPKYVEHYVNLGVLDHSGMIDAFFSRETSLLDEGKTLLLEEFGKEYTTYFSILALIASGKTDRGAITSVIQRDVGSQLQKLETDYNIIKAKRPLFSKPQSRNIKFFIDDNFLSFWFRFIFKYSATVELKNYQLIIEIIKRDFSTYSGLFLEKLIRQQLAESHQFSHVGNYWKRGNKNEIDVIAYNELTQKAIIGEVKMNPENISLDVLRLKAQEITKELGGYDITYRGYSLEDVML